MNLLLPQLKARDVIRVAKKLGFELDRQSGSRAIYYRKSDKRRIVEQFILLRILDRRLYTVSSRIWV